MFSFLPLFLLFGGDGILRPTLKRTTSRALSSPQKVKQRIRPKHFPPRRSLGKKIRPTKKFLAKSCCGVRGFFLPSLTQTAKPGTWCLERCFVYFWVGNLGLFPGFEIAVSFRFRDIHYPNLTHPKPNWAELLANWRQTHLNLCATLIQVETPQILDFNRLGSWVGSGR